MKNKRYKTRYKSIVPKGSTGECVDVVNTWVHAFKIKFENGECFWFMARDLEELPGIELGGETMTNTVNKPSHYIGVNGMEVEEVLQNFLPKYKDPYMSHRVGSAIEYQLRSPEKNGLEDLKKARKNLDQAIEYAERNFKADETILCKPKNNDPYDSFMYSLANLPNKPNWTEYFVPNSNVSTFYGGTNLND